MEKEKRKKECILGILDSLYLIYVSVLICVIKSGLGSCLGRVPPRHLVYTPMAYVATSGHLGFVKGRLDSESVGFVKVGLGGQLGACFKFMKRWTRAIIIGLVWLDAKGWILDL